MQFTSHLIPIAVAGKAFELLVPDAAAVQQAYTAAGPDAPFPYWTKLWPSAVVLSRYLLAHPYLVQGRSVLELAAGLGLPSVVAASYAAMVCCSDYDRDAVALVQQTVSHQRLSNVACRVLDWNSLPEDLYAEVILLSDVNYAPHQFDALHGMILRFLEAGSVIILATPQRLMAKPFIGFLLPFAVAQEAEAVPDGEAISVYVLKK